VKQLPYTLEYDQSVVSGADTPNFINALKRQFEDLGLDPNNVTENDVN
jgi:pyruvate/2-oxoglutarate dehydrogenase complex dihydrolipoamide acyltransferase (E2) component